MNFPFFLPLTLLAGFLLAAVWWDIRSRRIPNFLVLVGVISGLCWNALAPDKLGLVPALLGMLLGMGLFLPLYLMRAMGAGDVKLMAMVGAFLGPANVLGAVLGTFVAGGILAVAYALHAGSLRRLAVNLRLLFQESIRRWAGWKTPQPRDLPAPVGQLPYALAIALGTMGYLGWQYLGLGMGL